MKDFDVQTVELQAPFEVALRYIADPRRLPEWTNAFRSVSNGRAQLVTPRGAVEVGLTVDVVREAGTVDWTMTFPDGTVGRAFSRLVDTGSRRLYTFVLLAPPVALEELEGALAEQSRTLREELATLQDQLSGA
jgi:hypothetical protein